MEKDLLRILSFQAESVSRGTFDVQHLQCERLFLWYLAARAVPLWQAFPAMCETAKQWKKTKQKKQWTRQIRVGAIGETYILHIFFQALIQGNHSEAVAYIQRCKDMLLRLPRDVGEAPIMSCVAVRNAFLEFGGCCCKRERTFCVADGVSLADLLQLWRWYLQPEEVWGECSLVEVAITVLRKVRTHASVNKILPLFLQPKLRRGKNECKIRSWVGNPGETAGWNIEHGYDLQ